MTDAPDAPEYVLGHIEQALATDPRTGELELDIRVSGRRVFVTGTVATDGRRTAVGEVVAETAPGFEVVNGLSVADGVDGEPKEEDLG